MKILIQSAHNKLFNGKIIDLGEPIGSRNFIHCTTQEFTPIIWYKKKRTPRVDVRNDGTLYGYMGALLLGIVVEIK